MTTTPVISMLSPQESALVQLLAEIVVENTMNHEQVFDVRGGIQGQDARLHELASGGTSPEEMGAH